MGPDAHQELPMLPSQVQAKYTRAGGASLGRNGGEVMLKIPAHGLPTQDEATAKPEICRKDGQLRGGAEGTDVDK